MAKDFRACIKRYKWKNWDKMEQVGRKDEKLIDHALRVTLELARPQVSPYKWLYHNPSGVHTLQWFSHWAQRYTGHLIYRCIRRVARITGYELVPSVLFNRHTPKYAKRRVKIYGRSYFLLKPEEMSTSLARRYKTFCKELEESLEEFGESLDEEEGENLS